MLGLFKKKTKRYDKSIIIAYLESRIETYNARMSELYKVKKTLSHIKNVDTGIQRASIRDGIMIGTAVINDLNVSIQLVKSDCYHEDLDAEDVIDMLCTLSSTSYSSYVEHISYIGFIEFIKLEAKRHK